MIESDGQNNRYISHYAVDVAKLDMPERLANIYRKINETILEWQPQEAAIEEVFVSHNAASALKLGQARGAAIAACMMNNVPVSEYAARSIKQAVVGTGSAAKQQVGHMVKTLLSVRGRLSEDVSDALAIAICHGHHRTHALSELRQARRARRR